MALADTGGAVGAVTQLLHDRLLSDASLALTDVTVGRPEPLAGAVPNRLNLFLYEVQFDGNLRNVSLDEGQPAPLWLVLRYLLTAFDDTGESDTIAAHRMLGQSARVLNSLNFFSMQGLGATTVAALSDNPDMLKLTFEDATTDLLSKLMQGSDEKYRCSVAFQVRPVMIADGTPPNYSLLVGMNYLAGTIVGGRGVEIPVLPSMGPMIDSVVPAKFATGDTIAISGTDLHLAGLSVMLGPVELPVTSQKPDRLTAIVLIALEDGAAIAGGSQTIAAVQTIATGRRRSSNLLVGGLLPRLDAAIASSVVVSPGPPPTVTAHIDLTGVLMGRAQDFVVAALVRSGVVQASFDEFVRPPGPPFQQQMRFSVTAGQSLPPEQYRVVLRVNGQQAKNSPLVSLV